MSAPQLDELDYYSNVYASQTITLYFVNYHRGVTSHNSYTYLDNVAVTI